MKKQITFLILMFVGLGLWGQSARVHDYNPLAESTGLTNYELISLIGLDKTPTHIYYVSNIGLDSNDGLSPRASWAHHPWMSTWTGSVTLAAGDVVCMKRGDTWTIASPGAAYMTIGQSGSAGSYIATTAYGIGARPIINISTNTNYPVIYIRGHSFIKLDNLTITHYASTRAYSNRDGIQMVMDDAVYPHDIIITNCKIYNCPSNGITVMDDGYNITVGDINATNTATTTNYSNEIYDCGYAGILFFGLNITTGRSDYNIYHNYVHDIDAAASAVEDAYCIYFGSSNVNGWPRYCTAKYNYVHDNTYGKGIDSHGGSYQYIQDNYISDCRIGIDVSATDRVGRATAELNYCYVERNEIDQPGDHPLTYYTMIQMCAENSTLRATNGFIRDNVCHYTTSPAADGTACGIYVWNVDGVIIDGNHVYDGPTAAVTGGIMVGWDETKYAKNVTISNNFVKGWSPAVYAGLIIDDDITFKNNIFYSQGIPFSAYKLHVTIGDFNLYNNVFCSTTAVTLLDFHWGPNVFDGGTTLNIKNNIVRFATSLSDLYIYTPTTMSGTMTIDYNLYYNDSYATPFSLVADENTFAQWQVHGYDANGLNATDPLFKNTSGAYTDEDDFILQNTSSCINVGTNVSIDYLGTYPDIGAKEKR